MSSTDKLVIPAYKQGSEREFNEWFRNLRTAAKQHKYLLDIIEVGTIRPGAEREAEAVALHVRYKNVGVADGLIPATIDKYFGDLAVSLSRQLYGGLQNAVKDDDTLAEMLADEDADHYDDIKKGIAAIKSLIESEDTNSKNVRTKALRADLEKAYSPDALKDLTSASLAKFKTGIELANKFLKGSQWHLPDEVIEEYILDAIGAKGATLGANMRVQIGMQRQLAVNSGKTYGLKASTLAMQGILDQDNADRANEAKAAAQAAFEAEIASQGALKEELAAAKSQVAALQAQIKSDKGGGDRGGRAAAGRKPCPHCNGLHGGKCIGDLICKGVPVAKVLEELPDRIDHEAKVRMAQSSYKKVCAKSPGRTLPHDPFAKKSDSTAADHEEVRAALADSVTRTFDSDGIVGGFVAGVGTDQVEDTFPDSNPTDTPAILKAKTAARNAAEARARGGLWVKFTSFVTALPRPYIGASILLVLLACLIPVYMGSPASIGTPVADAVDEPSNMGVMVESVTALPLELSTGPATGSGGGAEYAIEEDPLQPIYRKVAGDMFRAVNNIDVPKTVPLVLSYTCIMLAMYVARMDAMQAHALVGHVKVVDAYDTTAGVNMPGSYAAGVDSKAGMNMFPTPDFFPHGWREPEKPIYIRCANNDYLKAKGVGTAYAFALADPTKPQDTKVVNTEWVNALYAPGLAMPLVSVKECKAQNIVVRFDLCPPRLNYPSGQTIYFGEDFNIHLMPLGASVGANAAKAIVRGKPGRRPTDGTFWRHALCISGDALKDLSKIADGVPDLSKMDRNEGLDDAALQANAKYHARRSTGRPLATRFGGSSHYDLWSPKGVVGVDGHRYALMVVDEHTSTITPYILQTKGQTPAYLRKYFAENEGKDGHTFRGGVAFCDNEVVLNSSAVRELCLKYGITLRNSCPYEPWQNGACERANATCGRIVREMMARAGGHGATQLYQYWGYAWVYAATIANATFAVRDTGKSAYELKTGQRPKMNMFYPWACKMIVKSPPHLVANGVSPTGEMAAFLGISRTSPGWKYVITEGPRKGHIGTTTQATFCVNELWNGIEYRAPTSDLTPTDIEGAWPEPVTADEMPDESDKATLDNNVTRGDSVFLPTTDNHAGGLTLDEEVVIMPDPANDGNVNPPAAGAPAPRTTRSRGGVSTGEYNNMLNARLAANATPFGIWAAAAAASPSSSVYRNTTDQCVAYMSSVDGQIMPMPDNIVPKHYKDIANISDPKLRDMWYKAYDTEFLGLIQNGTLKPMRRPAKVRVLPLKEIASRKSDGRCKWRGCVMGNLMRPGVDFTKTFASVVRYGTTRTVLNVAAQEDMELITCDQPMAYTWAERGEGETWYCEMPKGLKGKPEYCYIDPITGEEKDMVCEVGNLYGAPSAGNAWWNKVKSINKAFPGLVQSEADPSCFILTRNSTKLIVVIYVDDFGIFHSGTTAGKALAHEYIEHFNKHVGKPLKVHEGKVHEFLGLTITKTQTGFKLSASKYIDMLRARFFPSGVTHAGYKVPADKDLPSIVISAAEKKTAPDPQLLQRCQCLIGSLMFATNARPDIQYTVSQLARCMAWPDANIEAAAERCLIYLIGTQDLGLHYERVADPKLFGCSDANWCTRQSTSGCAFKIGTAIISYFSKKQGHISLSTFEAEISAGTLAACEAVHLRSLLASLGYKPKGPTIIKIDNTAALRVAEDPVMHDKTKHILRKELKIRELVESGEVKVEYVESLKNFADFFTKPLPRKEFESFRKEIMNDTA